MELKSFTITCWLSSAYCYGEGVAITGFLVDAYLRVDRRRQSSQHTPVFESSLVNSHYVGIAAVFNCVHVLSASRKLSASAWKAETISVATTATLLYVAALLVAFKGPCVIRSRIQVQLEVAYRDVHLAAYRHVVPVDAYRGDVAVIVVVQGDPPRRRGWP